MERTQKSKFSDEKFRKQKLETITKRKIKIRK
jgi:hypothetical protein